MDRYGRLAAFLAVVGVAWGILFLHESRDADRWILMGIGSVYALAALVMLVGTRRWTVRGLGLLGTIVGDALIYLGTGVARLRWTGELGEPYLDAVRAFFIVGGGLMAYGLMRWAAETRFGTRDEPEPEAV